MIKSQNDILIEKISTILNEGMGKQLHKFSPLKARKLLMLFREEMTDTDRLLLEIIARANLMLPTTSEQMNWFDQGTDCTQDDTDFFKRLHAFHSSFDEKPLKIDFSKPNDGSGEGWYKNFQTGHNPAPPDLPKPLPELDLKPENIIVHPLTDPNNADVVFGLPNQKNQPKISDLKPGDHLCYVFGYPGPDTTELIVLSVNTETARVYDIPFKMEFDLTDYKEGHVTGKFMKCVSTIYPKELQEAKDKYQMIWAAQK